MKRNPNGYGTVTKLSGNRAKPYAVLSPIYNKNGKRHRDSIGYYATEKEARQALAEWNKTMSDKINYTLNDIWEEWYPAYFEKISQSTAMSYKSAYAHLQPLYNKKMQVIKSGHYQLIIDKMNAEGFSYASMVNVRVVAGLLSKYAMQFDIIQKNYADFVNVPKTESKEKLPFTEEQIRSISELARSGDKTAQITMCLIYTGFRIQEFLTLQTENCTEEYLQGGLKTEAGRNRIVPVHPAIQPYIQALLSEDKLYLVNGKQGHSFSQTYFRTYLFFPLMKKLGILYEDGTPYTPHCCRHTFASLCYKYKVDTIATKKILGHSVNLGITESVYIHLTPEQLKTEIEKIPAM